MRISTLPVISVVGCVFLLGACTFQAMSAVEYFTRADLERAVEHILMERGGQGVYMAACPNALKIRVEALTRCTIRYDDGSETEVNVIVTEAAGDRGRIAVEPAGE
ncbi:DUF4333 domain-containing protein [Nocardia testacea]|uniref:DUF4333 domain-containing protein n=1 Tax=Nocardia testacea TaxID=248551 RepID=UPI003C2FD660